MSKICYPSIAQQPNDTKPAIMEHDGETRRGVLGGLVATIVGPYVLPAEANAAVASATDSLPSLSVAALDFGERTSQNAKKAAQYPAGTVIRLSGFDYVSNPSATGAASATADIGIDGLSPGKGPIDPRQFGAKMTPIVDPEPDPKAADQEDDHSAWQAATSYLSSLIPKGGIISIDRGRTRLNNTLIAGSEIRYDFGKSNVDWFATDSCIDIGWGAPAQVSDVEIFGGRHEVYQPDTTFLRVENAYAPKARDLNIRLRGRGCTGAHFRGTNSPFGPYYGQMPEFDRIYGNATPGAGQTGIIFDGAGLNSGSDGINRWTVGLRHLATVDYGVDVRNCHGLGMHNTHLESIYRWAFRFNNRDVDFQGTIDGPAGATGFIDASFPAEFAISGSVIILSGRNAGETANLTLRDGANLYCDHYFPYPFAAGDRYEFYLSKARNFEGNNLTIETVGTTNHSGIFADFQAGARSCAARTYFRTIASNSYWFKREIEDITNTIFTRYETVTFEKTLSAGTGDEWFGGSLVSNRGGVMLSQQCCVDGLFVSGDALSGDVAGEITLRAYIDGTDQGLAAKLTPNTPWRGRSVRKKLTPGDLASTGRLLKIKAEKTALSQDRTVRVECKIGYFN